jgi:LAO/AO transport system kinase
VLLTTATTGEGIPELLAALDTHRLRERDGATPSARLARAEAQVGAILADRLRSRLHAPARSSETRELYAAVARHDLDPYAAADRLLAALTGDGALD